MTKRIKTFIHKSNTSILRLALPSVLVLMNVGASRALAQVHSHVPTPQQSEMTQDDQSNATALVKIVRDSTERFKDVAVAEAEGYTLQFGCVSGDDFGAMGLHYVNGDLVNSGVLDATRPQIVIYEAMPDGSRQLIGADYLLIADAWDKTHSGPPELDSSFTCFRAPIASGSQRSIRCMSGPGRKTPRARS